MQKGSSISDGYCTWIYWLNSLQEFKKKKKKNFQFALQLGGSLKSAIFRSMQAPINEILTAYLKKETLSVFALSNEIKRLEMNCRKLLPSCSFLVSCSRTKQTPFMLFIIDTHQSCLSSDKSSISPSNLFSDDNSLLLL